MQFKSMNHSPNHLCFNTAAVVDYSLLVIYYCVILMLVFLRRCSIITVRGLTTASDGGTTAISFSFFCLCRWTFWVSLLSASFSLLATGSRLRVCSASSCILLDQYEMLLTSFVLSTNALVFSQVIILMNTGISGHASKHLPH